MTPEEIQRLFPDPEFSEAAGVLDVISKNPEQRQQYEARLKFQRDEAARLESARSDGLRAGIEQGIEQGIEKGIEQGIEKGRVEIRDEGLREGIEKGALLGRISLLQELLGVPQPTPEGLMGYSDGQLSELVEELKRQLRTRGA